LRGERHFEVGDLVMVLDQTGNRTKFDAQWRGPFRIVERHSTSFKIQHLRHQHPYPGLFDPDHLRLYYPRPERLTLDGAQLLEVEDIPPATLRARRRTRASHATARTLHPFIPQHRLSPRFLPSPPRSSLALTLLSRIRSQTSPPPSQVLQGTPRRLSW
jgi:hypothetical protein